MGLSSIPLEILLAITDNLPSIRSKNALARTNRRCYHALNRHIYLDGMKEYDSDRVFRKTVKRGNARAVRNFIRVGALDGPGAQKKIEELLNIAAWHGHADAAMAIIKHGRKTCKRRYMRRYCRNVMTEAIKDNRAALVEALIKKKRVGLEHKFEDGKRALHIAAEYDSGDVIDTLYDLGVDLYALDKEGNSALQIAAMQGNLDAADALLSCNFNVNFVDGNGNAAIHGLAKAKSVSQIFERDRKSQIYDVPITITRLLLDDRADPCLEDRYGAMPLWIASCLGLEREVQALLDCGMDPHGLDRNGDDVEPMCPELFKEMVKKNLSKFTRDKGRWAIDKAQCPCMMPLCIATHMKNFKTVEILLLAGADPNIAHDNGIIPLHMAAKEDQTSLVYRLIRHGALIEARDCDGRTALWHALGLAPLSMTKSLLAKGASFDCAGIRYSEYWHMDTLIAEVVSYCNPPGIVDTADEAVSNMRNEWPFDDHDWGVNVNFCQIAPPNPPHECERGLKIFLDNGTNVNVRDNQGRTPLHQAAFQNCIGSVKFLLSRGADPNAKDSFGQTPLHMACSTTDVIETLIAAGCDPNWKDENGDTPLHIAARTSCSWTIRIYRRLDGKADFLARNNLGNTPLHENIGRSEFPGGKEILELRRGGADAGLVNNDGKTVWDMARQVSPGSTYLTENLESVIPEEEPDLGPSGYYDPCDLFNVDFYGPGYIQPESPLPTPADLEYMREHGPGSEIMENPFKFHYSSSSSGDF